MPKQNEIAKTSFMTLLSDRRALPYDEFINWALYDPVIGYYTSTNNRVGKNSKSDFYTSSSLGSTWGNLVVDATCKLLGSQDPKNFTFLEIGAEPENDSIGKVPHPFKEIKNIRLGDPFEIPSLAVVFSNEWLDAQPFKRFRFNNLSTQWEELGVALEGELWMEKILLESESDLEITKQFPQNYSLPYIIDWPTGAENSIRKLSRLNWSGLFLAFDYGLDVQRIFNDFPEGTARSYSNHQATNNILQNPGLQDITCHVCWNPLQEIMSNHGFTQISIQRQESFFVNTAQLAMQKMFTNQKEGEGNLGALKELIHPQHLGHKFQALHAIRGIQQ